MAARDGEANASSVDRFSLRRLYAPGYLNPLADASPGTRRSTGRALLSHAAHTPLAAGKAGPLLGRVRVPGDKSLSHRALVFAALATGKTRITGLLEAEDVINTARAITALGAPACKIGDAWEVTGRGVGGLTQPAGGAIDFGNSGTGARLMMGVIAGHPIIVRMTGDSSLSRRPMARVLKPLREMGLEVLEAVNTLPLTLRGTTDLVPIEYVLPVPSAQVKSAVLIAGLHASGETTVIETEATRDHTERMLRYFGADVRAVSIDHRARRITVKGHAEFAGTNLTIPGDPSSAAFLAGAALIVPGSDVTIEGVLANPTRTGFYITLQEMGGAVEFRNAREEGGEPVADIRARYSKLKGVHVPPDRAPSMIDEYPILAVVAAFASGETRMEGLAELKVKESDRLSATAGGLATNDVDWHVEGDTLTVQGGSVKGGGKVATHLDHRIAMAFLTMGLASERPVAVDDTSMIATSFPEFRPLMERLGATFRQP